MMWMSQQLIINCWIPTNHLRVRKKIKSQDHQQAELQAHLPDQTGPEGRTLNNNMGKIIKF